jgi:PRTRC genetic system protein B
VTEELKGFQWAVPKELGISADPLRLRLDFYHQATELTYFENNDVVYRIPVDALEVAHALNHDLVIGTGLLPENTLWWENNVSGPIWALYVEEGIRKVALQTDIVKPVERFSIPLPPLIFLCRPGVAPWVFSVKKRPTKETDEVFKAPLANIFANGRSCPGNNRYPERIQDIVESFFTSFFSAAADLGGRSMRYPKDILSLWKELDGKKSFPMNDLVHHGVISDLMQYQVEKES